MAKKFKKGDIIRRMNHCPLRVIVMGADGKYKTYQVRSLPAHKIAEYAERPTSVDELRPGSMVLTKCGIIYELLDLINHRWMVRDIMEELVFTAEELEEMDAEAHSAIIAGSVVCEGGVTPRAGAMRFLRKKIEPIELTGES